MFTCSHFEWRWVYAIALFWLCLSIAYALPADRKEKVYIVADQTTYHYKQGVKMFEGHVKIDQGTTHLMADKVITKDDRHHQLQEAIAYGNSKEPAHYWTTPNPDEPEMHAKAWTIKYYPLTSQVILVQHAVVTQGENVFQGERIFYNINDQTVTVPASKNARAVLVYNPDK